MIYADNAATTKMSAAALNKFVSVANETYGNPSSLYTFGQKAKEALEEARAEVAKVIGAEPREILFTSGGSEADNQAIISAALLGKKAGKTHIISTAFEHHAVLHTLKKLEKEGFEVTLLDVHENGLVTPEEVEAAIHRRLRSSMRRLPYPTPPANPPTQRPSAGSVSPPPCSPRTRSSTPADRVSRRPDGGTTSATLFPPRESSSCLLLSATDSE